MKRHFVDFHQATYSEEGVKTYMHNLYQNLPINHNLRIEIYSFDKDFARKFINRNDYIYKNFRFKNSIIRYFLEIPFLIQNFDSAHFNYIQPFHLLNRKMKILTFHDHFPFSKEILKGMKWNLKRRLYNMSIKRAKKLTTVSLFSKQNLELIFPDKKFKIIPPGVKPFTLNKTTKEKDTLLFYSRIEKRKNVEFLIEAFVKGEFYKNYTLEIVGKIESKIYQSELKKIINANPESSKKINLRGYLEKEELIDILGKTKLFIYPSKIEGFGFPPLEVAATGIPTLCANKPNMYNFKELDGYFFELDNHKNLIELIRDILKNYHLHEHHFQKEVSKKILKNYNWSKSSKEFLEFIQN